MRLQHLAIGARFEYEGQVYVKTGPLTASAEQGGQRMIPRYADLKPLDVEASPTAGEGGGRVREDDVRVRAAFNHFCSKLRPLLTPEQGEVFDEAAAEFCRKLR
ncbi:hypothetical protein VX159_09695 [Dechloromonas sp. ZY10]|uniref:hypothetical protein n=1 Tax=Dechloromonas aquae TaxID=2664436 RepID=UPI003526DAD6